MSSYRNSSDPLPIMQGSPPRLTVPFADWDRPPWNRWSFQHIREILPTAEVWRGTGPASVLPLNLQKLDSLHVKASDGSASTLAALLDETYTDGFLVIHKGKIVYERYFNGMGPRTLHLSQSMAKSVTGAVAGILWGQGLIDPARPVTDYLPELSSTAWAGASLQHVLDMTTGVTFSEEYTNPYSEVGQVDVASGWKPIPPDSDPSFRWPRHIWELILTLHKTERPHGALFDYRSIETDVLAFVLERVSGKRMPQLVSELIWQKIGAEESASFTVDRAGYALAEGGFNATLRDFGRFGLMLLRDGDGIVPAAWVEETRNGNHALFQEPYTVSLPEGAYHNQFWIEQPHTRTLHCKGVFGQLISIDFARDTVAVKLSSWPDFLNTSYSIATRKAIHAITEELS